MDLPDDAIPLVTGVIREQLAEQVITSLNSDRVNSGGFYKLHLGGGKFNFPCHLVLRDFPLRSLGELFEVFEELLAFHGSSIKRRTELLLAQDVKVGLKPLEVGLSVACLVHQVTSVLVALRQSDLDTVRLCEPLGVLELCVRDGGLLRDLPTFAIPVLDVFWPSNTHLLE
jgi:hypothetical protein